MFFIVSYDIQNDKIRNRVAKIMKNFGDRVQYSVFECNMGEDELARMMKRLQAVAIEASDSIRVYRLCEACKARVTIIGSGEVTEDPDLLVI